MYNLSISLSIYIYIYICMYAFMYVCMYVCMYVYVYIYIYIYIYISCPGDETFDIAVDAIMGPAMTVCRMSFGQSPYCTKILDFRGFDSNLEFEGW